MIKLRKIEEGVTGQIAADIVYDNDESIAFELYKNGTYTSIPVVFDGAGYYVYNQNKSNGAQGTTTAYSYMFIAATPGETYDINARPGGGSMAAIIFFDNSGNNKGYLLQGDSAEHTDFIFQVPDGVSEMVYSTNRNWENNAVYKLSVGNYKSLSTKVYQLETTTVETEEVVNGITEIKNKYDYDAVGVLPGVITTSGGILTSGFRTGRIPVQPNRFYYLNLRNANAIRSLRCIASNGTTVSKVRVASTGEEGTSTLHYYLPEEDGSTTAVNGQFKTSPTAAFLEISLTAIAATEVGEDYKIMLEDVGEFYVENYQPSNTYIPGKIVVKDSSLEYPVKPLYDKTLNLGIKVLLIGSSHGMNTIGQFPILAYNSGADVICANAYQGSLSLQQVADYCTTGKVFSGWYKKFYDGVWHGSRSVTILQMLQDEKWDYISIQRSASEDMTWTTEQQGYFETILAYITANCGYTPTIVFNSGFADSYSIPTRPAQQADTTTIWDTAQQVRAAYGIDIIPMSPALQLVRNNDTLASLGTYSRNMLSCDSQHLDQGIGMYVSGCICFNFFLKHLGRSVLSCRYLPTVADMTPFWYDVEKFTPIEEQYAKEIRKIVNQYFSH